MSFRSATHYAEKPVVGILRDEVDGENWAELWRCETLGPERQGSRDHRNAMGDSHVLALFLPGNLYEKSRYE